MGYYIDLKCISIEEYKKILKSSDLLPSRMILKDNINKIKDFPGIADDTVLKLENIAIKNTLQLFEKIVTSKNRIELSKQTGIDKNEVLKITKLTDLSRIRWVNHTFAYVLLEAKYDTVEKVANANYKELFETVKQLNEERKLYKGHIGLHDMKLCVDAAKDVSLEIEY